MNYFNKIPTVIYDGYTAKNLLARAKLSDQTKSNRLAFYPYTMTSDDRIDNVSNLYYDDPGYTWLIWFANNVVDPYFDTPLSEEALTAHIQTKYGSYQAAARKIAYYTVNWVGDTSILSMAQFNSLPARHKRYYEPVVGANYSIEHYRRQEDDSTVATNKIIELALTGASGLFVEGEEVQVNSLNYAFVESCNDTTCVVKHVTGVFAPGDTITGVESGQTATVSSATTISETTASTDILFWKPVTFLDYEQELNERRKEIVLLDVRYKGQAEAELKRVMSII